MSPKNHWDDETPSEVIPSQDQESRENEIARRAYELYLEGGCLDGRDLDDWLKAERELTGSSE